MPSVAHLYPTTPSNVPLSITQTSVAFKKEVGGVMGSIVLFFIVYILLFLLSIGLVVACFYGGISIVVNLHHMIGILAGIGLIGVGIMIFIFLIKFLFAVTRFDHSNSILITETDQPELFSFIRQVTNDTQTPFPKKIYLSPDVNACVFYDSSFWSMLLPVKKNLQIGLGLVNSLNISEFKAVMAHEFGHFSQRSMKLGSFVYNVNKIIHNMLFENSSYTNFLSGWARVSDVFAFFANLTAKIAQAIQWVLRKMYGVVNKSYMSLSREMEFHADAVAASVSGSQPLITALRRIQLADSGYNITLQKCEAFFAEKKISSNIYDNHHAVLLHLAREYKLSTEAGLPVVTNEVLAENKRSRINFKDQWASHPTSEEREAHLLQLKVDAEIRTEPAWLLFRNKEELQAQLTQKIYEKAELGDDTQTISRDDFEKKLRSDQEQFSFPGAYNEFYDDREVAILSISEVEAMQEIFPEIDLEEIFSQKNASLPKTIAALTQDIAILKAFADNAIQAKTFDLDGTKYKQSDAAGLVLDLENELKQKQAELDLLDKKIIASFLAKSKAKDLDSYTRLQHLYNEYFEGRKKAALFFEKLTTMLDQLAPIYSGQTVPIEQINRLIGHLKDVDEPVFKNYLKDWLAEGVYDQQTEKEAVVQKFISASYVYFGGTMFMENELRDLNQLSKESWVAVSIWLFKKFKHLLELQLVAAAYKQKAE